MKRRKHRAERSDLETDGFKDFGNLNEGNKTRYVRDVRTRVMCGREFVRRARGCERA